ncbi:MAG: lytic transglycosylase domain-containing protein [Firmicutes bacterium]|nr:lytic transglycosylase domain-containing protein [Bacillota bacterium]
MAFLYGYWAPFPFQPTVLRESQRHDLNPFLVAAVIRVESRFRPDAISRRGAEGLMQLMPSSAQWIQAQMGIAGPVSLTNPAHNIALGTWYLRYLLTRYRGNETLALAAYNGGPATVDRWLQNGILRPDQVSPASIPYPETRDFVRRVRRFEFAYRIMYGWLAIGKHWSPGVVSMAKVMSEETKMKLGERLGVANIVRQEGWGGVPARECGNLVREAIRLAEEELRRS